MTASLRLTPRARADLRDIGRFTGKAWGRRQRDVYLTALDQRLHWLADEPSRGRPRPEIAEDCRSYPEGAHMIFYRTRGETIEILAVLHQAMDAPTHLVSR